MEQTDREQHVIHLGDVYYSGWPEEYEDHFLPNWPVAPGQEDRYGSRCLNANHDMFSGGHFDHLLKDERFRRQRSARQPTSYFSLENDHWQILGLDSAWQDGDLAGSQLECPTLVAFLRQFSGGSDDFGNVAGPVLERNPPARHRHR